eukprot:jgi/Ulvmu1/7250/UM035_0037.1
MSDVPSDANEHCPGTNSTQAGKSDACAGCPNQAACASAPRGPDPDQALIDERMSKFRHIILVLSGKGGVGKSTFSAQLAFSMAGKGLDVGLLDIDICGPSMPKMLGLDGQEVHQSSYGWSPVYVQENLGVMSIGFLLPNPDDAVIWRGPRKNGIIKQFLKDTYWGDDELDVLIVDAPPGTSDEHISIVQLLQGCKPDGALVITTPQDVAIIDVRKEVSFCKKTSLPVLGVVENMSGLSVPIGNLQFTSPHGDDVTTDVMASLPPELRNCVAMCQVFEPTSGGAEAMAESMGVPFLGRVPLDPQISKLCEAGISIQSLPSSTASVKAFNAIVEGLLQGWETGTTTMS